MSSCRNISFHLQLELNPKIQLNLETIYSEYRRGNEYLYEKEEVTQQVVFACATLGAVNNQESYVTLKCLREISTYPRRRLVDDFYYYLMIRELQSYAEISRKTENELKCKVGDVKQGEIDKKLRLLTREKEDARKQVYMLFIKDFDSETDTSQELHSFAWVEEKKLQNTEVEGSESNQNSRYKQLSNALYLIQAMSIEKAKVQKEMLDRKGILQSIEDRINILQRQHAEAAFAKDNDEISMILLPLKDKLARVVNQIESRLNLIQIKLEQVKSKFCIQNLSVNSATPQSPGRKAEILEDYYKTVRDYSQILCIDKSLAERQPQYAKAKSIVEKVMEDVTNERIAAEEIAIAAKNKCENLFDKSEKQKLTWEPDVEIFEIINIIYPNSDLRDKLESCQKKFHDRFYSVMTDETQNYTKKELEYVDQLCQVFYSHLLSYFRLALHVNAMYRELRLLKAETMEVIMSLKHKFLTIKEAIAEFKETISDGEMNRETQTYIKSLSHGLAKVLSSVKAVIEVENTEIERQEGEYNNIKASLEQQTNVIVTLLNHECDSFVAGRETVDMNPDLNHEKQGLVSNKNAKDDLDAKNDNLKKLMQDQGDINDNLKRLINMRSKRFSYKVINQAQLDSKKDAQNHIIKPKILDKNNRKYKVEENLVLAKNVIDELIAFETSVRNTNFVTNFQIEEFVSILTNISKIYEERIKRDNIDGTLEELNNKANCNSEETYQTAYIANVAKETDAYLDTVTQKLISFTAERVHIIDMRKRIITMNLQYLLEPGEADRDESVYQRMIQSLRMFEKQPELNCHSTIVKTITKAKTVIQNFECYINEMDNTKESDDARKICEEDLCLTSDLAEYLLDCDLHSDFTHKEDIKISTCDYIKEWVSDNSAFFMKELEKCKKLNIVVPEQIRESVESITMPLGTFAEELTSLKREVAEILHQESHKKPDANLKILRDLQTMFDIDLKDLTENIDEPETKNKGLEADGGRMCHERKSPSNENSTMLGTKNKGYEAGKSRICHERKSLSEKTSLRKTKKVATVLHKESHKDAKAKKFDWNGFLVRYSLCIIPIVLVIFICCGLWLYKKK